MRLDEAKIAGGPLVSLLVLGAALIGLGRLLWPGSHRTVGRDAR